MKKATLILVLVSMLTLVLVTVAPAGEVMDRILKKGELVVGITGNQPPLNGKTKSGKIIGLDADLAQLMAANLGVKIKFAPMPFAQLLPAMEKGKVDMIISGMTMLPQRNLKVAFVGPYFVSGKGILTKAQHLAALQDADGLNKPDFKVAALKGSTSQMFVERTAPRAKLVTTANYDEAIDMLLQNKIDAVVADYPFCSFSAFRYRDKGLMAGQSKLTFEPLGIAVPEDTLLLNWVQNYMILLEGSGALKAIGERWFKDSSWIKELP
jgi:polar amino acid transport system substrate-binding protein